MQDQIQESPFRAVAEAAWAVQAGHWRFRFEARRPDDHPSRVAWVQANAIWAAQSRWRKARRQEALSTSA